jgi:hypothetical protein
VHQAILSKHDAVLVKLLGYDLPLSASPSRRYVGPDRIIAPTVRTCAAEGESINFRVLLAAMEDPAEVVLCWRWLGGKEYVRQPFAHVARRVYQVALPRLVFPHPAVEYHVEAQVGQAIVRWPASDRGLDQTLIMFEPK